MTRKMGVLAGLVILMLLALFPIQAGAAGGTSLEDAIEINGVMQGTLTPSAKEIWFTYWDPGDMGPVAFTMNWFPATPETNDLVTMRIWKPVKNYTGYEPAEVGRGMPPNGQGVGVRYWRTSGQKGIRYYVQVRSDSEERVDFALGLTGDIFPPPGLHVNVGAPVPVSTETPAAQPTIAPAEGVSPVAGTATATPTPTETRGKKANDAIPLGGTKVGLLPARSDVWYVDTVPDLNIPVGFDLNYSPADGDVDSHVLFKVWAFRNTPNGPVFEMIGASTKPQGGMEHGMKYWRTSAYRSYTVYIQIVNDWDGDIAYGIANVGTQYPPPQLPVGTMPSP